MKGTFDRSGFASLRDLSSTTWRTLFDELEKAQHEFLLMAPRFRHPEYRWPSDTLHTCTRVWEYPFVYYHIKHWRQTFRSSKHAGKPIVVDLGSGVTFFPLAIARLKCNVVAIDNDPVCEIEYEHLVQALSAQPGTVQFSLGDATAIPLPDSSVDCLYCVSVLEHIHERTRAIGEIHRVLKPGGLLILTFDIDLKGNFDIGAEGFYETLAELSSLFDLVSPERTIHPMDVLTSDNSPYPLNSSNSVSRLRRSLSNIKHAFFSQRDILASTYGTCLMKQLAASVESNNE